MKVLVIGDVFALPGVCAVERGLSALIKETGADFTVLNGENSSHHGLSPENAGIFHRCGADVITLGNHTYSDKRIIPLLEEESYIIRPYNFPGRNHGAGAFSAYVGAKKVCVISLVGRYGMYENAKSPFSEADRAMSDNPADVYVVDFHAEATSEKKALGYYLDGKASIVFGTHTHVQTADIQILPNGTGYVTDVGMTGAQRSVIGADPQASIEMFLGRHEGGLKSAVEDVRIQGALFVLDDNGKCIEARLIDRKVNGG